MWFSYSITYPRASIVDSVHLVHPVSRIEPGVCGDPGTDEHHGRGAGESGGRVVEHLYRVVVGVAEKLGCDCAFISGMVNCALFVLRICGLFAIVLGLLL